MRDFLNSKVMKCFNVYINPVIIGALFSALGSWDFKNDKYIWIKILSVIVLLLWYIFTSYKYYKEDEEIKTKLEELSKKINDLKTNIEISNVNNKTYNRVLISLTSLFSICAEGINNIANNLLKKEAKLDNWNYKTICAGICNGVYETLCIYSNCFDFSVSVMLYDINAKGKAKNIKMIAQKGRYEGHPDIFETPLSLTKYKDFYAVKMFKKNSPDISILTTNNDINKNFVFSDNGKDHPKYSQYIGIPIQCSGKQMISLLQICAFNDSKIADSKDEIMEFVNKYILPFTYFALLNNKIEKGLANSISVIERKENENAKN